MDGKQLTYVKEFESLQPLNDVINTSSSSSLSTSESGNDEEDMVRYNFPRFILNLVLNFCCY